MKRLATVIIVGFCGGLVFGQSQPSSAAWLDLKVPSIEVHGSWTELAKELHRLGIRASIENVVLEGMDSEDVQVSFSASDISLRDLLDEIVEQNPEIGWREDGFRMCRMIALFRRQSRWEPTKNPLNMKISKFSLEDVLFESTSLWLSDLLYHHSPEFRQFVNPHGLPWGPRAESRLGGFPTGGYKSEIRHSVEFRNTTLREILNSLVCISLIRGRSWHFTYRADLKYPSNYHVWIF